MMLWNDKPYHSLDYELKERFNEKVYRLTLNGGMSCPNRDGTLGHGGCIFCSGGGSGEFAADPALSIRQQIEAGKKSVAFSLTFRSSEGTLTDEQISPALNKIFKNLKEKDCILRT